MKVIDLNCDMGELPEAIADGTQESLMPFVTSVNIACGGHAGDVLTMRTTIQQALHWKRAIGAHPGYPDRANFGRVQMNLTVEAVADTVLAQIKFLAKVAADCGTRVTHVKPHGALYNKAASHRLLAEAIAGGIAAWSRDVVLVGLAGSSMLDVFREAGFAVAGEAFADRRYEANGGLRSRAFADAMIVDPEEAGQQALDIIERGVVTAYDGTQVTVNAQTICIHSDTPGAAGIAADVAQALRNAGITLRALSLRMPPGVAGT